MKEVGEGVFQVEGTGRWANAFLIRAPEPVLVDAGTPGGGRRVAAELERAGIVPVAILLTHIHFDHAGGAGHVRDATGAPIWAPAAEQPLFTGQKRHRFAARAGARIANAGRRVELVLRRYAHERGVPVYGFKARPLQGAS